MRKTVQIETKIKKEFPNLTLPQNSLSQLESFLTLLLHWNAKLNLTAIREEDAIIVKHFLDTLVVLTLRELVEIPDFFSGQTLDMGSGAGIPGIILAICHDQLNLISIDKSKKKIAFQEQVVRQLRLNNVKPIQIRLQELSAISNNLLAYDVIIARAFDQIKNILYFGDQFLKSGGYFLLWKGEKWGKEWEALDCSLTNNYQICWTRRYQFREFDHGGVIMLIQKLN